MLDHNYHVRDIDQRQLEMKSEHLNIRFNDIIDGEESPTRNLSPKVGSISAICVAYFAWFTRKPLLGAPATNKRNPLLGDLH